MNVVYLDIVHLILLHHAIIDRNTYASQMTVCNTTANWTTATSSCGIARLALLPADHGVFVEDERFDNILDDIDDANGSWVGIYRREHRLSYLACKNVSERRPNFTTTTVGRCYQLCYAEEAANRIALMNTSCYCFDLSTTTDENMNCTQTCPNEDILCGSVIHNLASVYLAWSNDSIDVKEGGGDCLTSINDTSYMWRQCDINRRVPCTNSVHNQSLTWRDYTLSCNVHSNPTGESWKRQIRSWSTFVFNYIDGIPDSMGVIQAGYIVRSGNRTSLQFASPSLQKTYVCQSGDDDEVKSSGADVTKSNIKEVGYIIYVGCSIAGVLCVIVIVVVVNVVFRRKQPHRHRSRDVPQSLQPDQVQNTLGDSSEEEQEPYRETVRLNSFYTEVQNNDRSQVGQVQTSQSPPAVVPPTGTSISADEFGYSLTYDNRQRKVTNAVYDTVVIQNGIVRIVEESTRSQCETDNVYDKAFSGRTPSETRRYVHEQHSLHYDTSCQMSREPRKTQSRRAEQCLYSLAREVCAPRTFDYSFASEVSDEIDTNN